MALDRGPSAAPVDESTGLPVQQGGLMVLSVLVATAVTGVLFRHRLDYLAHVVGSYGLVLVLFWLLSVRGTNLAWPLTVLGGFLLTVGLILVGEAAVFGQHGDFDALDVAMSVLGATLAAVVLVRSPFDRGRRWLCLVFGLALVVVSFAVRYGVPKRLW